MVTRCLSLDLADSNIFVTSLHPGYVQTDLGGPGAWINTQQSVEGMMKIMANATQKDGGKMITYEGEVLPW